MNQSEAFAAQALSDLEAYTVLAESTLPMSQRLHSLQMWLEKLCKAYLLKDGAELQLVHNVIAKVLPKLISEHWRRMGFSSPPDLKEIHRLCREIDLLQPQINADSRRPDNAEYPWESKPGSFEVPAQWKFPLASRLESASGRWLLKVSMLLTRNPAYFLHSSADGKSK